MNKILSACLCLAPTVAVAVLLYSPDFHRAVMPTALPYPVTLSDATRCEASEVVTDATIAHMGIRSPILRTIGFKSAKHFMATHQRLDADLWIVKGPLTCSLKDHRLLNDILAEPHSYNNKFQVVSDIPTWEYVFTMEGPSGRLVLSIFPEDDHFIVTQYDTNGSLMENSGQRQSDGLWDPLLRQYFPEMFTK